MSPGRPLPALRVATAAIVALVVGYHYLSLITTGTADVLAPASLGLTYNSMALHLLQGQFDVDPAAIGHEAFVRDGRTYAYFGIFPALLRLPLAAFVDLHTTHLERLSCLAAMLLGAAAQVAAVFSALAAADAPARRAMLPPLLLAALFSGPAVMLGRVGAIYFEVVLWAWALAMVFVALAIGGLRRPAGFGTARLTALAALAGCCLLTRASTGFGLYAGTTLLVTWLALRADGGVTRWQRLRRALVSRRIMLPLGVLALFAGVAGGVNQARWGTPFSFADFRLMAVLLAEYPERLARAETYGMFNIRRLGIGLIYYLFPVWIWQTDGHYWLQDSVVRMTDGYELPPSSLLISDPLTSGLMLLGLIRILRHGRPNPSAVALLAGLATTPLLMLMSWGMAFRYRAEFAPVMVAAACLAAADWAAHLRGASQARLRRTLAVLTVLAFLQMLSAQLHSVLQVLSPLGPFEVVAPHGLWPLYQQRFRLLFGGEPPP